MSRKFTSLIVLVLSILIFNINSIFAQCPGCINNPSCIVSPAAPTICPLDTLPPGVANQPYNEDISIYLPANFNDAGSGYNVDLTQLDILNISGMPYGLNWETSASPSNIFYPTSNPPNSEHGCAKMCGTPLTPGNYTITINVLAHVNVTSLGGLSQTSNSSFTLLLTILPASTSNSSFTIDNPIGCAPLTTTFSSTHPSGGNPAYSYMWNFGNGNLSNLETPPLQSYPNAGTYPVSLQTNIDTLGYYLSSLTLNSSTGCDDWPFSNPDYYFNLLLGGSTIYTAPYINNSNAPQTFSFSPIQMQNQSYTVDVYDWDTGLAGGDDYCGSISFNGNTAGTYNIQSGNINITYTITHPIVQLNAIDTITVYASPTISSFTFLPNDTVCSNDSIKLEINSPDGATYQWYQDTTALLFATNTTYYAHQNGNYYVEITNAFGCRTNSAMQHLTFVTIPPVPTFWRIGDTLQTSLTGYYLQWYLNNAIIPGATLNKLTILTTGDYFLTATNPQGCSRNSDTINYIPIGNNGIEDLNNLVNLKVFPNPNDGKFTLNFELNTATNLSIYFKDILGKEVYSEDFDNYTGKFHKEFNFENLPKSIYFLEIRSDNKININKILIQ